MATAAELNFLIRMQNQASATLTQVATQMGQLGAQVQQLTVAMNGLNTTMTNNTAATTAAGNATRTAAGHTSTFTVAAQRAAAALASMWAANKLIVGSLSAFSAYDKAMNIVQRTTVESAAAMSVFKERFNAMAIDMRAVPVDRLLNISVQAAQLGLKGADDILTFTRVIGMLETSLNDLGENAPKLVVRVLEATGEGVAGVEKFANVLVRMGKEAYASSERILSMTSLLAQATAKYNIMSEDLLGLATAAANLNFTPQLFGTAMQRTLQQLETGVLANTEAFKSLSVATGISREEMLEMINNNPANALMVFHKVLKDVAAAGRDQTQWLRGWHLDAAETARVTGSVAKSFEQFSKYLNQARIEAKNPGALMQEWTVTMDQFAVQVTAAKNAWQLFKVEFGRALSPQATQILVMAETALIGMSNALHTMPTGNANLLAWAIALVPVILAAGAAVGALTAALRALGGVAVVRLIGALIVMFGSMLFNLGIIPVAAAVAAAALITGATTSKEEWQKLGDYLQEEMPSQLESGINRMKRGVANLWAYLTDKEAFNRMNDQIKQMFAPPRAVKAGGAMDMGSGGSGWMDYNRKEASDLSEESQLHKDYVRVLSDLDAYTKALFKVKQAEEAIAELRTRHAADLEKSMREGVTITDKYFRDLGLKTKEEIDAHIARLDAETKLNKILADPEKSKLRDLALEAEAVRAVTTEEKNRLEIAVALRAIQEKKGGVEDAARLRREIENVQAGRGEAALRTEIIAMQDRIRVLQIGGPYMEADRQAEEKIIQLRKENATITPQLANSIREYHRALDDLNKSQTLGIEGWQNSLGTMRTQLLTFQKDAANALSDAMTGWITGATNSWQSFFTSMKTLIARFAVNNMLSEAMKFTGMDNNMFGLFSGFSAADAAKRAAGIANTASMTVTAGVVNVNGSAPNLLSPGGLGGTGAGTAAIQANPLAPISGAAGVGNVGAITPTTAAALAGRGYAVPGMSSPLDAARWPWGPIGAPSSGLQSLGPGLGSFQAPTKVWSPGETVIPGQFDVGAIEQAAPALTDLSTSIGNTAEVAVSSTAATTGLTSAFSSMQPAIGNLTNSVGSFLNTAGSAGPGFFSSAGSWFTPGAPPPVMFHKGGLVGEWGPRLHNGLRSDEFRAVLQRGERVLTANDNKRAMNLMGAAGGSSTLNYSPVFNIDASGRMQKTGEGGGGPEAERLGRELDNRVRAVVVEVMQKESRQGGMLKRKAA